MDDVGATLTARASGSGMLRQSAASEALAAAVNTLRDSPTGGNVVVLRAPMPTPSCAP
jgi:hypothetical protein